MILILTILITLDYAIFILLLVHGFTKIKSFTAISIQPITTFSILVPFRNEEKVLLNLLSSISKLNYPKELFEIIAIDDASTDQSVAVFNKWRFQNGLIQTTLLENLRLTHSPKKDALLRAMPIVKNTWVVTTDADCELNENWLTTLDCFIQKTPTQMIVGAVTYKTNAANFLHAFQQSDLMSLQGVTIGSFGLQEAFMCNGANFAYQKSFFKTLNGFAGNEKWASGDDVFLLQKALQKHAESVHYLKHKFNVVSTNPENNVFSLFMQRVRWASKTGGYQSDFAKGLALMVLLMNGVLVVAVVLCFCGLIDLQKLFILFTIKFIIDYPLLFKTNQFLGKSKFIFPVFSSLLYPFFSFIVGLYAIFGTFTWKGRRF